MNLPKNDDAELRAKIQDLDAKMDQVSDILDRMTDHLIALDKTLCELKQNERKMMEEFKDLPDEIS